MSAEALASKSGPTALKTIPSRYLVTTDGHAIPPATQESMATRAHAIVYKVQASHVAMISQPAATLRVILTAATANRNDQWTNESAGTGVGDSPVVELRPCRTRSGTSRRP